MTDRGLTFATNGERGLVLSFARPVTGIDPLGLIRHPELTLTRRRARGPRGPDRRRAGAGAVRRADQPATSAGTAAGDGAAAPPSVRTQSRPADFAAYRARSASSKVCS